MRATGARGQLIDNPIEYYNYLLQPTKQVIFYIKNFIYFGVGFYGVQFSFFFFF